MNLHIKSSTYQLLLDFSFHHSAIPETALIINWYYSILNNSGIIWNKVNHSLYIIRDILREKWIKKFLTPGSIPTPGHLTLFAQQRDTDIRMRTLSATIIPLLLHTVPSTIPNSFKIFFRLDSDWIIITCRHSYSLSWNH